MQCIPIKKMQGKACPNLVRWQACASLCGKDTGPSGEAEHFQMTLVFLLRRRALSKTEGQAAANEQSITTSCPVYIFVPIYTPRCSYNHINTYRAFLFLFLILMSRDVWLPKHSLLELFDWGGLCSTLPPRFFILSPHHQGYFCSSHSKLSFAFSSTCTVS